MQADRAYQRAWPPERNPLLPADRDGRMRHRWVDGEIVLAMACAVLVPGYRNDYVTNMRLWIAQSSSEFDLQQFNRRGDYIGAVQA
jgi:starch phosphorylase